MAESRSYDLDRFDTLHVTTGIRAIVTTGTESSVRVEARDAQTLDRLDVEVTGGRLHIGFARNLVDLIFSGGLIDMLMKGGGFNVTAYVSLPALNGAEASSGGRIEAGNVKSDRFRAEASSGGMVTLFAVSGGDWRASVSSGALVEVGGRVTELDASASSGGNLRADKLTALRGRLEASSGGHVEATVTERLRAYASSGGHVEVFGSPADRDVNSSSGGHVSIR